MTPDKQERRLTERIPVQEDIFVGINDNLYTVHDISMDGISFEYAADEGTKLTPNTSLALFFMHGPILYIDNIPCTIVADLPLATSTGDTGRTRRACTRFDDLTFRQLVNYTELLAADQDG